MPEAPRDRPENSEVLHEFRAHLLARPRAVFDAVAGRMDPGVDAASLFTADPAAWLVISQGGRWYRSEYRVVPDETGSNLEHTLVNVAGPRLRLRRFSVRKVVDAAPAAFERLVRELRIELE